MTRRLSILAGWMLFASTASAQHNATVQTKGTVADGEVAVFDGVTGKFIRSAGDTNVTHYYTNLIAILEAATNGQAQLQVATNTLTANVDALIIGTNNLTADVDKLVTATNLHEAEINALIVATNNLNVDVDKLVIATNLHQAGLGALVTATNTLTANVDALIIGTNNLTGDVDKLVTATNLHEAEINAIITATNLHQASITALVIATNGLTSNVVALVTATNTLTVNVDALIIATNLHQASIGALVTATNLHETEINALIVATNNLNVDVDKLVIATNLHQASIGALVTATNTLTANLDALIMTNSAFGGDASGTYAALVVTQVADRALATVTNQLTLGVTAYGWGNHSTNGYLTQGTNRWDELFVANLGSTGANMVVNGGFTNTNNWALSATANIAGGILNVNAGLAAGAATQTVTFTRAKTHKITLTKGTTAGTVVVGIGSQTSTIASNFIGEWIGYLPSVATNDVLHLLLNASASLNQYIDNITVAEVTDGDLYVADNAWVGGDLYLGETNSIYFSDPTQGGPSLGSLDILSWKSQGVSNAAFVTATNNLNVDVDKLVTATNTLTANVDALIIATNNLNVDVDKLVIATNNLTAAAGGGGTVLGGYISGFKTETNNTTSLLIYPGEAYAGDVYYNHSVTNTHTMLGLVTDYGWHYICIETNQSTASTVVFTNVTTSPIRDLKTGNWHVGGHRVIGAVESPSSSATVTAMKLQGSDGGRERFYSFLIAGNSSHRIANNMNPDGSWQAPSIESGTLLPTNAIALKMWCTFGDAGAASRIGIDSLEYVNEVATVEQRQVQLVRWMNSLTTDMVMDTGRINLGESNNIRFYGDDNDDNKIFLIITHFWMEL